MFGIIDKVNVIISKYSNKALKKNTKFYNIEKFRKT
jgi:hypothetical protein